MNYFTNVPEFYSTLSSSSEDQIKFLQAILKIQQQKLSSMELKLKYIELNREAEVTTLNTQLEALDMAKKALISKNSKIVFLEPIKRKRWFNWRSKDAKKNGSKF